MKKSIIAAGAASVALAAMPMVGAFAAFSGGPFTDIIRTSIGETCTFARGSVLAHDPDNGDYHGASETWAIGEDETSTPAANTDTAAIKAVTPAAAGTGAVETTLGSSNFYVICNDTDGYQVSVSTTALTNGVDSQASQHPWAYVYDGDATSTSSPSYWKIYTTDSTQKPSTGAVATAYYSDLANNIVSTKGSAEDGHDFTVTYKAFAKTGQDSGTYKATATYTAAQLPIGG